MGLSGTLNLLSIGSSDYVTDDRCQGDGVKHTISKISILWCAL